jgi:hypothetical protein
MRERARARESESERARARESESERERAERERERERERAERERARAREAVGDATTEIELEQLVDTIKNATLAENSYSASVWDVAVDVAGNNFNVSYVYNFILF